MIMLCGDRAGHERCPSQLTDASRLLLLVFVVTATSEYSDTAKPTCKDSKNFRVYLPEGESLYFVPRQFAFTKRPPDEEITWYKNDTKIEFSDENDRIHYHGVELFLFNLLPEDSGLYTARHVDPSGKCSNHHVNISVLNTSNNSNEQVYGSIENSYGNKLISCPDPVRKPCDVFKGNFTWFKDSSLIKGERKHFLWVKNATERDEGIYTCVCAWTYNNKTHNSSGSRKLQHKDESTHSDVQIISPINMQLADEGTESSLHKTTVLQLADEGAEIKLNCTVFCGINVKENCHANWTMNGKAVKQTDRYKLNTTIDKRNITICTSILTITKVSAEDFQAEFLCKGKGGYTMKNATLRLTQRESIIPLVIWKICVMCFFVLAVVLVKYFIVDLTLFFRPYIPVSRYKQDMRLYDAYVVYQSHNLDKASEDTLYRFVTNTLPSVLEEKCGYRLFIHGRDGIPGEDLMEPVEERMKQSRRLMLILTLETQSQSCVTKNAPTSLQSSHMGAFDWQVGFHHALMQTEVKVIVIQLGATGPQGYARLPPSLQHLIRRSPPIVWPEGSRAAARFWKRVRYLMPALPARERAQASESCSVPARGWRLQPGPV